MPDWMNRESETHPPAAALLRLLLFQRPDQLLLFCRRITAISNEEFLLEEFAPPRRLESQHLKGGERERWIRVREPHPWGLGRRRRCLRRRAAPTTALSPSSPSLPVPSDLTRSRAALRPFDLDFYTEVEPQAKRFHCEKWDFTGKRNEDRVTVVDLKATFYTRFYLNFGYNPMFVDSIQHLLKFVKGFACVVMKWAELFQILFF